jgi:aspartyl-tRNA(Asn)/glutamyl-tRNA(Gln) amidotransferase subunit A
LKDCLEQIKKTDSKINAFVTVCEKEALQQADLADKAIGNGINLPLLGIPIAVKDNFSTQGIKTTASSKVLDNYIPPYDATVINKLKAAGMVMIGKTNMDAWAHGSSTETSDYGATKNPWNINHLSGGGSCSQPDNCGYRFGNRRFDQTADFMVRCSRIKTHLRKSKPVRRYRDGFFS